MNLVNVHRCRNVLFTALDPEIVFRIFILIFFLIALSVFQSKESLFQF